MAFSPRLKQAVPALAGLAIFLVTLVVLRSEVRALSWHTLVSSVMAMPRQRLWLAALLTVVNYAALTGYDFIAFADLGRRVPRGQIALTAFLAYALSNTIGFAMLTGASVRHRFYSRLGITAAELSQIVLSYSVTFWLGLFALGGISLGANESITAGAILITIPILYFGAALAGAPLRVGRVVVWLPAPALAAAQIVLSSVEWLLAAAILYVLLPQPSLPFITFAGVFLIAILIGIISHIPGGMGVFEGVLVLLLAPHLDSRQVLPSLVVFRVIYFLGPLLIGLTGLIVDEAWQRRVHVVRVAAGAARITTQLTPFAMSALALIAGVVLLFSGATPAAPGRLAWLNRWLPLGVIEVSHFAGSVIGAILLVLSQGLARRLDAAYAFAVVAIVAGMAASLLKGVDYEEVALLILVLAILWTARPAFDRKAALFEARFSIRWLSLLIAAVTASVWLGLFAFQHVDYSNQLWWQFELFGEASRFLRASVGAAMVLLLTAARQVITHAPHRAPAPADTDLDTASQIIASQHATSPMLVYLRDKSLIFNEAKTAFLMYAVQGRSWVVLGDPVGPPDTHADLIRVFLERCDDGGGVPVFYEVGGSRLHLYADFGLRFVKIGEAARVDLAHFTLEHRAGYRHRQALRRLEKAGAIFRVLSREEVVERLPELRAVSEDWLAERSAAEKGFSLGFFDGAYLARFPAAIIERDGEILAFANLWAGAGRGELSLDLMRHRRAAPSGVMESLVVHVMQWGQQHGYRSFVLGMAPLSGFEASPVASLWNRLGAFIFEYGEAIYNFQGLRAFKAKFHPEWEPHYLAYPGGLRLPRIMADVSALVAGGYRQIFSK
ncbi:MAG: bifunctional lysylphosphatidylglycerol flippase/synthetase MprF [Cyanobacteria bacterium]|nr:bifunctional lysylphosphatidylglycerol flippase/synthetase MprF [Cyanobacteriota bacterium]